MSAHGRWPALSDDARHDGECLMCEAEVPTDGEGLCTRCVEKAAEEEAQIVRLEEAGHTAHCAARQTWGDGACECQAVWLNPLSPRSPADPATNE